MTAIESAVARCDGVLRKGQADWWFSYGGQVCRRLSGSTTNNSRLMRNYFNKRNRGRNETPEICGFTVVELIVTIAVAAVLMTLSFIGYSKYVKAAKSTASMQNIKQFVSADLMYFGDYNEFPVMDGLVPSTMTRNRLQIISDYLNLPIPAGPVARWPKRKGQPKWINCPLAVDSGYAEGVTLGGGVYTGYIYVGGVEDSKLGRGKPGTILHPGRAADRRNTHKGVLWASILNEFSSGDSRRYECFHYSTLKAYKDFRFHQNEITGQHRGWSDGAVEWVPSKDIKFGDGDSDRQLKISLGYFYY